LLQVDLRPRPDGRGTHDPEDLALRVAELERIVQSLHARLSNVERQVKGRADAPVDGADKP
jgi:hypothetical protein